MDVPTKPLVPIGERIGQLLQERGKKAAWLADEAGTARSTITRAINGGRGPSPQTLAEIAEAFGMDLAQLVAGTDAAARVAEADSLVPKAQYEELVAQLVEYERRANEAEDRARRATEEAERERAHRLEAVSHRENLERELRQTRGDLEASRKQVSLLEEAFTWAATEVDALRGQLLEVGAAVDEGRKTGRVGVWLAGAAAAASASALTYLAMARKGSGESE